MSDPERGELIDKTVFPGLQGGPLMHVIAAKAVAFHEALQPDFGQYIDNVLNNARVLADALQEDGLRVVSGGTDNHLLLVDLTAFDVSGRKVQNRLERAGITTNRNQIPNDPRSAFRTSGLRLGTSAVTTRGFGPDEMRKVGRWISDVVRDPDNEELLNRIAQEAAELGGSYPLPGAEQQVVAS